MLISILVTKINVNQRRSRKRMKTTSSTLGSLLTEAIAKSMTQFSLMAHNNQHLFLCLALPIHGMTFRILATTENSKKEIWDLTFCLLFHQNISLNKNSRNLTRMASSSVVSSPAKITFTLSAQLSPNSLRKIYNAASPTQLKIFVKVNT